MPKDQPTQPWHKLKPQDQARLAAVFGRVQHKSSTLIGYPCNQLFDYSELYPFLGYHMNNVGDPYSETNYGANTHDIEREVLDIYSELTQAPPDNHWGYVTNGGTEGNLYGLYLARELHPKGIVYFSEDTHYSVAKSLRLLGARSIMIRSLDNGEIDYTDLYETLRIHRDCPAIIFANVGTTMKGAIDDVGRIAQMLEELRLVETYIHVDAALSGMILPFVDDPPAWNFAAGADSISTSGHKMIGSPLPCGMVLAKKTNVDRIARSVEYVGVLDTTLTGSRNALTPLLLWYAMKRLGIAGMKEVAGECLSTAQFAVDRLVAAGVSAYRNPHSITVVFPRPHDDLIKKWQIAPYRDIGHLITMPHVSRQIVEQFVKEYLSSPADAASPRPSTPPGARLKINNEGRA